MGLAVLQALGGDTLPNRRQLMQRDCSTLSSSLLCEGWAVMQAMGVDTLPTGRQLTYGAYKDCSRPLRRTLKQLGSGSIDQGIAAIKFDSKALEEVAALLTVDQQVSLANKKAATNTSRSP